MFDIVILTNRDKIVIGYITVMDYMFDLSQKKHISSQYRNALFSKLFTFTQSQFFPTANIKEVQQLIEEMNILRTQMRSVLSNQIIQDAKVENGGLGLDKAVGEHDNILTTPPKIPDDFKPKEGMDSVIEFYKDDVLEMPVEQAIMLIKGTARKTVEFKDWDEKELIKLITERIKEFKKDE